MAFQIPDSLNVVAQAGNSTADNLLIGIVSSLLAVLIVFGFNVLWKRVVEPWYENRLYHGAKIEGDWFGFMGLGPGVRVDYYKVNLKRTGYNVTGSIECLEGPDQGERWVIEGSFRNMILCCVYDSDDEKYSDRGALAVMLTGGGRDLRGVLSFYQNRANMIDEVKVWLSRDKGKMDKRHAMAVEADKRLDEIMEAARVTNDQEADEATAEHETTPKLPNLPLQADEEHQRSESHDASAST